MTEQDAVRKMDKPDGNVCLFSSEKVENAFVFPFQFVYETMPRNLTFPRAIPYYICHLITEGTATLKTDCGAFPLAAGDLFFVYPDTPYTLSDFCGCKYLYISFIGSDLDRMLESYGVAKEKTVFCGYGELTDHWFGGLGKCTENNLPTLTRGILYYTLALLPVSMGREQTDKEGAVSDDVITQIRSVIDRGYGNSSLSLEYICSLYNYHPKYISRRFREVVGFSFSEYLQSCRMRHARELLQHTDRPIQEIAAGVGYRNALYFSRVFRKCFGMPPSEYRRMRVE